MTVPLSSKCESYELFPTLTHRLEASTQLYRETSKLGGERSTFDMVFSLCGIYVMPYCSQRFQNVSVATQEFLLTWTTTAVGIPKYCVSYKQC